MKDKVALRSEWSCLKEQRDTFSAAHKLEEAEAMQDQMKELTKQLGETGEDITQKLQSSRSEDAQQTEVRWVTIFSMPESHRPTTL